ncbi:MAG: hypothetical protein PGN29_04500 [Gordonia paraffinivorans]
MSDYLLIALWGVVAALAAIHAPRHRGEICWCRRCADRPVPRPGGVCDMCRARRIVVDDAGIDEFGF